MAVLYSDKGDFDHCLSKYLKAIDIYDWLDREELGIYDDDIARLKNNLGTLYSDRDEYNKALSEFNEAARIRFELLAKDNDPDSRSALADIYCNMATALQFSDHSQEALRYIAQAHAILDELDKEFPRIYEYKLYSILNREGSTNSTRRKNPCKNPYNWLRISPPACHWLIVPTWPRQRWK